MILWQRAMITLARNKAITDFIHNNRILKILSKSFVGGKDEKEILKVTNSLKLSGIDSSFFYLGEYVNDRETIEKTVLSLLNVIEKAEGSDIHISVDPTQMGLLLDFNYCMENIEKISEAIKRKKSGKNDYLMLDMEDSSVIDSTLKIFVNLIDKSLPCGITLQAYLKRTINDLYKITEKDGLKRVRLVKGAFAEKTGSYTKREDIDKNYLHLAKMMLDKKVPENGLYPVFATHDHRMVEEITKYAEKNCIGKDRYEFEMLYGVRSSFQKRVVKKGYNLRLYTPYGTDWWPYSIRRIGENPKNLYFVLRSLLGKIYG